MASLDEGDEFASVKLRLGQESKAEDEDSKFNLPCSNACERVSFQKPQK